MKQNKIKKGFTLVELLVVIAILAILATVSIVGYSSFTKKAKYSNDVTLVTEWNQLLDAKDVLALSNDDEKLDNIVEVKDFLKENGSTDSDFIPTSDGYHFYWSETDNNVYLVEDNNSNFTVAYPEDSNVTAGTSYKLNSTYYTITADIEGITLSKKFVESGATNTEITLTATGVDMPSKVKIGADEYTVTNSKIAISNAINSNVVIEECAAVIASYLTFSSDNSFTLTAKYIAVVGLQSSTDTTTWTDFKMNGSEASSVAAVLNSSDNKYYVYLRGKGLTALNNANSTNLVLNSSNSDDKIDCTGNIMSLLNYEDPNNVVMGDSAFSNLFKNCKKLRTAPSLPAEDLADYCYSNMFYKCTSLTVTPDLPATGLMEGCYFSMFYGCEALTSAPALSATTLADSCYNCMFYDCSSLRIATSGDAGNKIFTCPSTGDYDCPVDDMFASTSGSFIDGTPVEGTSYYWYTAE